MSATHRGVGCEFCSSKSQLSVRESWMRLGHDLRCVLLLQTDRVLDPFLASASSLPSDATQTDGRLAARGAAPYMPQQRGATQDMGTDGLPEGMEDFDYQVCSKISASQCCACLEVVCFSRCNIDSRQESVSESAVGCECHA